MIIGPRPSGMVAGDPLSPDGIYHPRPPRRSAVRRWVRRMSAEHTGTCPTCGTEHTATAQFIAVTGATLYRHEHGTYAVPGYQLDAEPDWTRVCPCTPQPPTTTRRRPTP